MLIQFALAAILLTAPSSTLISSETCDSASNLITACTVENSGEQVDIGAGVTNPAPEPNTPDGSDWGDEVAPPPDPTTPPGCAVPPFCRGNYVVEMPPDVTIADLASFRPDAPTLTGEPVGFGIVGAPTNVVAAASEQFLSGPLLGWNVTVRFVPEGYVFDYGDGTTERFTTGGARWASLGQPQFTPTTTSHAYRDRGTYAVSVTVQYSAAVDFGSGTWRPVTGYVTASGATYDVRVVEARTALVDQTCVENPGGPGC